MTPMALPFSPMGPRSDLDLAEAAWLVVWRTLWLDLPLAWASEVDRFLFRWIEPADTEMDTAGLDAKGGQHTVTKAVALNLGCDPSEPT
ncbi:hypothetical protein [Methylobacterium sp. WCS2018Hpa-22]|uniref:hypothetical protein n=1 Tax=Methylobacterium sp. WCS2018Hpa-22 TaxID=3073633 RepID=UPI00288B9DDC|nr:hypothetical protein [Methylobacterium sp. WCS2018Hpa-22]